MARTGSTTLTIDGHTVKLSSLDRVMYPEAGFTKGDVVEYYRAIAEPILRQLRDRVVTQIRFPQGVGGERFYQKNASRFTPDWIRTFVIPASPDSDKPSKNVTWPSSNGTRTFSAISVDPTPVPRPRNNIRPPS